MAEEDTSGRARRIWCDTEGILNPNKDEDIRLMIFPALVQGGSARKSGAVRFVRTGSMDQQEKAYVPACGT